MGRKGRKWEVREGMGKGERGREGVMGKKVGGKGRGKG